MANKYKLRIKTSKNPAITISREAIKAERLVYIAVANKPLQYPGGKSRIAYIGTTKNGSSRIAGSAAYRAPELLSRHGLKELSFFVVTCTPRKNLQSWAKLEVALILAFKDQFGAPPMSNIRGKNQDWNRELDYFTMTGLKGVIDRYSR